MRWVLLAIGATWAAVGGPVRAQPPPTNCRFPVAIDRFVAKVPGEVITAEDINAMRCVLNALQERAMGERGVADSQCVSVNVPAGGRVTVPVVLRDVVRPQDGIYVTARDLSAPGHLAALVHGQQMSSQVQLVVVNYHPTMARVGIACVAVIRGGTG